MTHLGTLQGRGQIMLADQERLDVEYRIDVFRDGGLKTGRGSLPMALPKAMRLIQMGALTMRLEDGAHVSIVVTKANDDGAEFVTSGPIPGF
jgi:hypothetical protein